MIQPGLYDRMFSLCPPEVAFCVIFIPSWCLICRDLHAFLWVKFGLEDLLRVKDLTFCNSAYQICHPSVSTLPRLRFTHIECICPRFKMYFSPFQNLFVNHSKYISPTYKMLMYSRKSSSAFLPPISFHFAATQIYTH